MGVLSSVLLTHNLTEQDKECKGRLFVQNKCFIFNNQCIDASSFGNASFFIL